MLNLYLSKNGYDGMTPDEREIYEDLLEHRRNKKKQDSGDEQDEDKDSLDCDQMTYNRLAGDTFCEAMVCYMSDVVNCIYLN